MPYILLFIFFISCNDSFEQKLTKLEKKYSYDQKLCEDSKVLMRNNLIENESKDPKSYFLYSKSESEALEQMKQINYEFIFLEKRSHLSQSVMELLTNNCSIENYNKINEFDKSHSYCSPSLEYLHFFEALIETAQQSNWSKETKQIIAQTFKNIFKDKHPSSFRPIDVSLSFSILRVLVEYDFLKSKFDIVKEYLESEKLLEHVSDLNKEILDLIHKKDKGFCSARNNAVFAEQMYRKKYATKFLTFVKEATLN